MKSSANPPISVVMSVHNSERFLEQAIDSILAQTMNDFDFIIVNDGSTDRSSDILRRAAARDMRLRIVNQPQAGVAAALNSGLALAAGEFIARMDSDDISLPMRLEKQLAYMRAHTDHVAISCRTLSIDPEGWPIRISHRPLTHDDIDRFHMNGFGGGLSGPAAFMRREAVIALGGYRTEYVVAEDYDLWLRLAETGRLANLPDILLYYREHATGLTQTNQDLRRTLTLQALREAHTRRGLPYSQPRSLEEPSVDLEHRWAQLALAAGYYATARKYAWRRLIRAPGVSVARVFVEATIRPVAEPFYDVIRFRRPRPRAAATTSPTHGFRANT
jgi:GT2 family glycosyltransferase